MVLVMPRKGAEYAILTAIEILKALKAFEELGKNPSTLDLANFLKKDYSIVLRYRNVLEKLGWIEVVPEANKNIIRLTERGRCIASCL